jgi:PAS domain-containing protein
MGAGSSIGKNPDLHDANSSPQHHGLNNPPKLENLKNSAFGSSKLLVENESARESFYDFLMDEKIYNDIDDRGKSLIDLLRSLHEQNRLDDTVDHLPQFNGYVLPNAGFVTLIKEPSQDELSVELGDNAKIFEQFVELQLLSIFPYFVKSPQYHKWMEDSVAHETSKALCPSDEAFECDTRSKRVKLFNKPPKKDMHDILNTAKKVVCQIEMSNLSATGISWLDSVLSLVENIPVCFSMATASTDRYGFPLIYVNKAFERVTTYKREDIIGQNCRSISSYCGLIIISLYYCYCYRFLQGPETEPDQVQRLTEALRLGTPVKVVFTNYRKNGTPFKNMLAMKPVYDSDGTYRFVFGAQIDATFESTTSRKLKLVTDLLTILPNTIGF